MGATPNERFFLPQAIYALPGSVLYRIITKFHSNRSVFVIIFYIYCSCGPFPTRPYLPFKIGNSSAKIHTEIIKLSANPALYVF